MGLIEGCSESRGEDRSEVADTTLHESTGLGWSIEFSEEINKERNNSITNSAAPASHGGGPKQKLIEKSQSTFQYFRQGLLERGFSVLRFCSSATRSFSMSGRKQTKSMA